MPLALDLLIRGADVHPGDGPPQVADVGVAAGRIAAVAPDLSDATARAVVDGAGLLLCPGFIDLHAHTALHPFVDPLLAAKVGQGFTTELINPDGLAPAPVGPDQVDDRRAYLLALEGPGPERWSWSTFAEYLDALHAARPAISLVPSIGHSAVRDLVLGSAARAPDEAELARMRREVRLALEQGARTLSFGLIYLPGMYADTPELLAVAEEAARVGAPLVPHVRDEADRVLEAIGELAAVARASGAPLHLSHLKVLGHPQLVDPLLELVDATAADVDVSFDQYPYGAGSTTLAAQLPPWALEGGAARTLVRLRDPVTRATIAEDIRCGLPGWQSFLGALGADAIVVAHAAGGRGADGGKSIAQIADERATDVPNAIVDLLVDSELDAIMIPHYADDACVEAIFAHPRMLVGSDGIFGPQPHPRLYGTAARTLGDLALERGVVSVDEAVARLTARAADRLRLTDRGRIRPGLRADLVLLDPARFRDRATYADPRRHPDGVELVLVAGEAVWRDGGPTGARPGGVVREPLPGA